jgi:hypothetical protein
MISTIPVARNYVQTLTDCRLMIPTKPVARNYVQTLTDSRLMIPTTPVAHSQHGSFAPTYRQLAEFSPAAQLLVPQPIFTSSSLSFTMAPANRLYSSGFFLPPLCLLKLFLNNIHFNSTRPGSIFSP